MLGYFWLRERFFFLIKLSNCCWFLLEPKWRFVFFGWRSLEVWADLIANPVAHICAFFCITVTWLFTFAQGKARCSEWRGCAWLYPLLKDTVCVCVCGFKGLKTHTALFLVTDDHSALHRLLHQPLQGFSLVTFFFFFGYSAASVASVWCFSEIQQCRHMTNNDCLPCITPAVKSKYSWYAVNVRWKRFSSHKSL